MPVISVNFSNVSVTNSAATVAMRFIRSAVFVNVTLENRAVLWAAVFVVKMLRQPYDSRINRDIKLREVTSGRPFGRHKGTVRPP